MCTIDVNAVRGCSLRKFHDTKKISTFLIIQCTVSCTPLLSLDCHTKKFNHLQLVNAIARHTHPSSVQLLFAFDYTRALLNTRREESLMGGATDTPIPSYLNPRDWQRELIRLGVTNDQWKVTEVNKKFLICNR